MKAFISLLRGVNVGGHNKVQMSALRTLYESLGFESVQTYVQSGNVVFQAKKPPLASRIEEAIEKAFGFRPAVILRTCAEMREVVARNPFAGRPEIHPGKLLVSFLADDPGTEARDKVRQIKTDPEELWIEERELYIYFPNGMARPKLSFAAIDKALKVPGTGRNWNTVTKLLEMGEQL